MFYRSKRDSYGRLVFEITNVERRFNPFSAMHAFCFSGSIKMMWFLNRLVTTLSGGFNRSLQHLNSISPVSALSIKQPFQSDYLMDISRCIERLEIARSRHFRTPARMQLSAHSGQFYISGHRCLSRSLQLVVEIIFIASSS
jgi:hypothetical protein